MGRPASGKGKTVYVPNDSLPFVDSVLAGNAVGGIYAIKNSQDGKVYIGSTKDFHSRWKTHRSQAVNGKHHNTYLQSAIAKHGAKSFSFVVLEVVEDIDLLVDREQAWLDGLRSFESGKGYNLASVALPVGAAQEARKMAEGIVSTQYQARLPAETAIEFSKLDPIERGRVVELGFAFEANGCALLYKIMEGLGVSLGGMILGESLTIICNQKSYEGDNQAVLLLEIIRDKLESLNLTPGGLDDEPKITD